MALGHTRLFLFLGILTVMLSSRNLIIVVAGQRHVIAVHIPDEEIFDAEDIAKEHGFEYGGRVGSLIGYHTFERDWEDRDLPHKLAESTHAIQWFEEQTPKPRFRRQRPPVVMDPLFSDQWHLHSESTHYYQTGTGGQHVTPLPNLNVMDAWQRGVDGSGVTIAVVDDGVQWRHPDLLENYVSATSVDICEGGADPSPSLNDYHGTSVAGTAAAARNDYCGVGVAPRASIAGVRLLGTWPTDAKEAAALSHACTTEGVHAKINHVFVNSWGPADDGQRMEGPGRITRSALEHCITRGRNGLGSIYVWAAGNGRANGDDANYDGYASSRYTIAVAAVTEKGIHAWYSEPGASILCAAPSSGWSDDRGIATTDLSGFDGATSIDCTRHFGGTSAAAPMIAGVVAMMLQANPFLGWRDVQHILILSCNITDPLLPGEEDGWSTNGAGLKHSHAYGFGIPDASQAVRIAHTWVNVATEESTLDSDWLTPAGNESVVPAGRRLTVLSWSTGDDRKTSAMFVEHVELTLSLTAPQGRGWITLTLCSPAGSCSYLARQHTGDMAVEIDEWTYDSVKHWGENPVGTWNLKVENTVDRDNHNRLPAVVHKWRLQIYGHHR